MSKPRKSDIENRADSDCVDTASEQVDQGAGTLGNPISRAGAKAKASAETRPNARRLRQVVSAEAQFVTLGQAETLLNVSRSTLFRFRQDDPTFPEAVRLSSGVKRLLFSELLAWILRKSQCARSK